MKRIREWFEENKMELVGAWGCGAIMIIGLLISIIVILDSITKDIIKEIENKQQEIIEVQKEIGALQFGLNYYYTLYENSVPLQQYIQDIEYLESVIRELRDQCETYNNKEN